MDGTADLGCFLELLGRVATMGACKPEGKCEMDEAAVKQQIDLSWLMHWVLVS